MTNKVKRIQHKLERSQDSKIASAIYGEGVHWAFRRRTPEQIKAEQRQMRRDSNAQLQDNLSGLDKALL